MAGKAEIVVLPVMTNLDRDYKWFCIKDGVDIFTGNLFLTKTRCQAAVKDIKNHLDGMCMILPQTSPKTRLHSFAVVFQGGVVTGSSIQRKKKTERNADVKAFRQALQDFKYEPSEPKFNRESNRA